METLKKFTDFLNEKLYLTYRQQKNIIGNHNILYLIGSRSELTSNGKLNIPKPNQSIYKILSQFGDKVEYPILYWRGGNMLFDEIDEIIKEKSINVLVGNSAGGFLSFYFSNKYKIPSLSINPAFAPNSEAPILQTLPSDIKDASLCGKQLVVIGDKDSKSIGGVDGQLVINHLNNIGFEEKGGEILILPNTKHHLTDQQFNSVFKHFYKKYVK